MSFHPNEVLRRARVARGIVAMVFIGLVSAFFRTQVLRKDDYLKQSEGNRLREVPLPGARAIIYASKGEIIAENLPGYRVSILSPTEDSLRLALGALARIIPSLDSAQRELAVRRFRRSPQRPAVIFNDAAFDVVSVLEERRVEFPGLIIQSAPKRYYPDAEAVASFVGYTGEISEKELGTDRYAGYKPGQQVGKTGLEAQYESRLRGTEGLRFVEVDARNRVVKDADVRPDVTPEAPPPLHTNIDLDLQKFARDYFGDSLVGAMVALEPKTGAVRALYSAPSYDVNRFIGGVPALYLKQLNEDKRKPQYNKATQGAYPPASTWKLATAVMGLQRGLVDMDTHMERPCTGGFLFGRVYKCWEHKGHGDINLAQAIAKSCDVYFYQLGLKLQLSNLIAGGLSLGMGSRSGIDLPNEFKSRFPDQNYKKYFTDKYGARGWIADAVAINMSIGQGDNAQTPINMAKFYTALATDGNAATPRIVDTTVVRTQVFQLDSAKLKGLQLALADVVTRGTAAAAQIQGLTIAGKTGTGQVPGSPDVAWFVGYAPVDNPKIVIAVLIEAGLHGPRAALAATKMMERYLKKKLSYTAGTPD